MRGRERLLIIGAGPKALALAAKNEVLAALGLPVPEIQIIERHIVGAHWTGRHGYTNGRGLLGTLPDKDIGFPYQSDRWGERLNRLIDDRMLGYSWTRFLVASGQFSDWIDRGRPAPSHHQWAGYLQWVAASLGANTRIDIGEVTSISLRGGRWRVEHRDPEGRSVEAFGDGLVMTGPGKPRWPCAVRESNRVRSATHFWRDPEAMGYPPRGRVAIIGAGESAASVAVHLVERCTPALRVDIISPNGVIHSRGESYGENRVYSDPTRGRWQALSIQDRRQFILRTDRGVFSSHAQGVLNNAPNVDVVPGWVRAIVEGPDHLDVEIEYGGTSTRVRYDQAIVAMGPDPLSFLRELLDAGSAEEVLRQTGLSALVDEAVEERIGTHLELVGLQPRLHLPAFAGVLQGPGFANLSCLGRLSDLVLASYVQDADQLNGHETPMNGAHRPTIDRPEPHPPLPYALAT